MNAPAPIHFYFDFSSPYAYIASEWIAALAARHGRPVRWHAILLGVTFQAAELKSPVSYPIKREYSLRDFARSARFEGVPLVVLEAQRMGCAVVATDAGAIAERMPATVELAAAACTPE